MRRREGRVRGGRSRRALSAVAPAVWALLTPLAPLAAAPAHPVAAAVPALQAAPELREVRVEVEGRTVQALCTPGPVRLFLLHDEGGGADDWRPVLQLLAGPVGACAYDRTGSGGSDPAPTPRGWFELAAELAAVHEALGAAGPAVLVGHGVGGLYARLFAAQRRDPVAGLVLLDPAHEDLPARARPGMPAEAWEAWMEARARPNDDGVREVELAERARRVSLGDIPVTVVTASERRDGPGWNPRWVDEAARRLHGELVAGLRLGRHLPAPGAGHDLPAEAPRMVAEEIVRVMGLAGIEPGR